MTLETADLAALATDLKKAADVTKATAELTNSELKNLGKVTDETKLKADEALAKMNTLQLQVDALEQKAARRGADAEAERVKSAGEQVIDDERIQAFCRTKGRGSIKVSLAKAITSSTAAAPGSAGALVRPDRRPGVLMTPTPRLTVRDLCMPGETDSNMIEYLREAGYNLNAASVEELALKPESDIQFSLVSTPVTTIAHWMRASRQILDDAAQLRSVIDQRLRYGVDLEVERQLLSGTGTGGDLQGILPLATPYSAPVTVPGATPIDILRLGMLQTALAEFPATGIVLNSAQWVAITLSKDNTGQYLFTSPTGDQIPRLWGLPVVETTAIPTARWIVGAFRPAIQVFDRQDTTIEISTEDRDNFVRNACTILGETRLAVAHYRPEAVVTGLFA